MCKNCGMENALSSDKNCWYCGKSLSELAAPVGSAIYVIVRVTYDYFRYQDNEGASADLDEARKIARAAAVRCARDDDPWRVIESEEESRSLDDAETAHIWIEYWPNNVKE